MASSSNGTSNNISNINTVSHGPPPITIPSNTALNNPKVPPPISLLGNLSICSNSSTPTHSLYTPSDIPNIDDHSVYEKSSLAKDESSKVWYSEFLYWISLKESAVAVAVFQALTTVVKMSKATTLMGLEIELKAAVDKLKSCNPASISLAAGCDLFIRYVTRISLDIANYEECKIKLIKRGEWFSKISLSSRTKIAQFFERFIHDNKVVLVHGFSRVVKHVLLQAAKSGKVFSVILTEGRPTSSGWTFGPELVHAGIPVSLVLDSAVAHIMSKVDMVLVGAEGVLENGGIINKIGTYQIAMVASLLHKPFYVAAESYKFVRLFCLTQDDLPETQNSQRHQSHLFSSSDSGLEIFNPSVDFTPPQYISLIFTEIGILTPSAISDELIKYFVTQIR